MTQVFDARGLILSETDPLGHTVTYAYNTRGQLTQLTSKNGVTTTSSFDAKGNLTSVVDPLGNTLTSTFDAQGNRTTTTDRAGHGLSYQYDPKGRFTRYVDPSGMTTTYGYDALSRMTLRSTTPYTYNGDGALVDDGATRYTQDLASPLSQILQTTQISTTNYLYGLDRLAAVAGSTRTWYVGDALRSVCLLRTKGVIPTRIQTHNNR